VRDALGKWSLCSSYPASFFGTGSPCGAIVRSSKELGSVTLGWPNDECDERGDGVNVGELSSGLESWRLWRKETRRYMAPQFTYVCYVMTLREFGCATREEELRLL
jgi:hypothetical protein